MLTNEDLEAMGFSYYQELARTKHKTPLEMSREFATTSGQRPDPLLYIRLIEEEFEEWLNAPTTEDELKELADLLYVIYGYANAQGWDVEEAHRRVHANNMGRMYQPDGTIHRREDGKILRNQDFPPVDLGDLI